MENNIPYGFKDDGKPDLVKVSGSFIGFRNFQTRQENQKREEQEWRDKLKGFPVTIQEVDAQMNIIRQNPKAYDFENTRGNNEGA